jgi:hypothetical protein
MHFSIILRSTPTYSKWSFPSSFSMNSLMQFSYPRVPHVTPISFSWIWRSSLIFGEKNKAWSSSLCDVLQPYLTSFLWRPNIFMNTVLEHPQSGYFSQCQRPKVTHIQNKRQHFSFVYFNINRSRWPRGLRRGSTAARLLGLWVRIPPRACMSVSCECCVLSNRGLCVGLVTRPEESYRLWCVLDCVQVQQ